MRPKNDFYDNNHAEFFAVKQKRAAEF